MRSLVLTLLLFVHYACFAMDDMRVFETRFNELSDTNRLLSSAVLIPELKDFINKTNDPKKKIRAFILKSRIYLQYEAYSESMHSLLNAEKLAKQTSDSQLIAHVGMAQAQLNISLERYSEAIDYIENSQKLLAKEDESHADALLLKGRALYYLGNFKQAMTVFQYVKDSQPESSYIAFLAVSYKAQIALAKGKLELADRLLKQLSGYDGKIDSEEKQLEYQVMTAQLALQQGNFEHAIKTANELLQYTLDTRFLNLQARLQDILSKSFFQIKKYRQAFVYMQRHNLTINALALKKRNNRLLQLEAINNLEKKQQRIRLLEKEGELVKTQLAKQVLLQQKQQMQTRKWLFLGCLFVVFSWLTYYIWHRRKLTKHLSKLVKERTIELEHKNKILQKVSHTDSLTGVHNRHYLHSIIDKELSHTRRAFFADPQCSNFLALLLIDIDHFKQVNDKYGHAAGDKVLAEIGKLLQKTVRDSDFIIRWGGEEFLIVLRECALEHISTVAEQIRKSCEDMNVVIDGNETLQVTLSIGYVPYPFIATTPKLYSWEDLMELADYALYSVKQSRRNGWIGLLPNTLKIEDTTRIKDVASAIDKHQISVKTNIKGALKFINNSSNI